MNKAPDTRNKLDSNAGIKKRKKAEKYSMSEFKEIAPIVRLGISPENARKKAKKLTPGQQFKLDHGFSLTTAKLMKKNGCETLEGYRLIRKEKKKAAKKAKKPAPVKVVDNKTKKKK
jgi:hypothetical protein